MVQSSIAWLDFSEQDRRRMIDVVRLFSERDTRDELGLGSIRDALADRFFPGTGTLQTRARYFFFVPWLYLRYEQNGVSSQQVAGRLKQDEVRLIRTLKAVGEEGIIGARSGDSLQRFPSSIYWNGLRRWGILRYPGSQAQYHRWLDAYYRRKQSRQLTDDQEPVEGRALANWSPGLPKAPAGFPDQAGFQLRSEEAAYLQERLLLSCSDSLLATLVDRCLPVDEVAFIWQHPQLAEFPPIQQAWVEHAHNFSDCMYGAVLLYNLMLAELGQHEELATAYREELESWQSELANRTAQLLAWDRQAFWRLVAESGHIPRSTQGYVDNWLDILLLGGRLAVISDHSTARSLVREREVWLKRGRSRFESQRHLETWSGAAGVFQLDFRWSNAIRITNDILHGIRIQEGTDATS